MSDTLTHKDLSKLCGVSETTIKSYRRKFPNFIPVHTEGKPIRFKQEAGEVCLAIRECFERGMSINETHKVLKGKFKEYRRTRESVKPATAAAQAQGLGVSQEYLEKFFETAGQMMHGMAQMATAQARADKRLQKVEQALGSLADRESRNEEMFTQLLNHLKASPPESAEARSKARKIINVRSSEGVKSYELEADEQAETVQEEVKPEPRATEEIDRTAEESPALEPEAESREDSGADTRPAGEPLPEPSQTFMETPIVIRNDKGEFLGVPGRLPLEGFIKAVVAEGRSSGAVLTSWERRDRSWVFIMQNPASEKHELFFGGTKTPRGNLVVLFWRLDVNGEETSASFLEEFFRQIKDRIVGQG